jgi:hypothetical protein
MSKLFLKYKTPVKKYSGGAAKFNPTIKWVEYSLDLIEAKRLLQTSDFTTKFQVMAIIEKIENKVKFHQNHKDFDLSCAIFNLRTAKKLLRL